MANKTNSESRCRVVRAEVRNTNGGTTWIPESTALIELKKILNDGENKLCEGEHIVQIFTDHCYQFTEAIAFIEYTGE